MHNEDEPQIIVPSSQDFCSYEIDLTHEAFLFGVDFFVSLNLIVYMNCHKDIKMSIRSEYECAACVLFLKEFNLMQLDMGSAIFENVFLSCLFHKSNSHHSKS